ncbi:hypothetical protein RSOL_509600 [Rhizoctonia solani AG-3 Rhs1AP]|uniref:Uncharacterized protein n=1 Tax=Rhizoctonia solani AG-3 Rhs1AP TaxID=1086054 RepID=X8JSU9_9AGAM|nr:hypothetical protein RSOL_509600 [Rhizoctonia solani AG-3 Rhs1AP]
MSLPTRLACRSPMATPDPAISPLPVFPPLVPTALQTSISSSNLPSRPRLVCRSAKTYVPRASPVRMLPASVRVRHVHRLYPVSAALSMAIRRWWCPKPREVSAKYSEWPGQKSSKCLRLDWAAVPPHQVQAPAQISSVAFPRAAKRALAQSLRYPTFHPNISSNALHSLPRAN